MDDTSTSDGGRREPAPSFEDALQQLGAIVQDLEEGNLTLDESLAHYEQGIRYLNRCHQMLSAAERKIDILSGFDANGDPVTQPLDDDQISLAQKADLRSQRPAVGANGAHPPDHASQRVDADGGASDAGDIDFRGTLF